MCNVCATSGSYSTTELGSCDPAREELVCVIECVRRLSVAIIVSCEEFYVLKSHASAKTRSQFCSFFLKCGQFLSNFSKKLNNSRELLACFGQLVRKAETTYELPYLSKLTNYIARHQSSDRF